MQPSRHQILEIVRAMRTAPAARFTTQETANRLGLSAPALTRGFRKVTGVSPLRFRSALRMEAAKRLLSDTGMPVTEVALHCGYESLGSFVRIFGSMVGFSPGNFRRAAKQASPDIDWIGSVWPADATRCICGSMPDPQPLRPMLVALGLFETAVPSGRPMSGQVSLNGGRYVLPLDGSDAAGYLLGLAVPVETSRWHLSSAEEIHVFARRLPPKPWPEVLSFDPSWRRLTPTDPPIVTALPNLPRR